MNAYHEAIKHGLGPRGAAAEYIAPTGAALAVLSAIGIALAGLGSRWGLWYFTTGFALLAVFAVTGLLAAIVSLVGGLAVRHEHHRLAFFLAAGGILIGLVAAGIPLSWLQEAKQSPPIHDISTDTVNPPEFHAVLPLRQDAVNSVVYGGPVVAAQQHAAYPDVRPVILPLAPSLAFDEALKAASDEDWRIVQADAAALHIEATATTFWFGFKDDIVVRITPVPGGSRVDVRSLSRVGRSDVGTNAARIENYYHALVRTGLIDRRYSWGY